jgi:hypothetical protein
MFASASMLWWAAAAAVPIAIFLFARQRFRRVEWAAMDFLLRAFQKQRKRLRVENLLLLILRCAALIVLALAWADPRLEGVAALTGGDSRREVVVVLDDSFSTGFREASGETPFRLAREQALRLVRGLRSERGDAATVVASGKPARVILRRATDLGRVAAAIDELEVTDGANDLAGALTHATAALEGAPKGVEVYILTDLQKSAFFPPPSALPTSGEASATPPPLAVEAPTAAVSAQIAALRAAGATVTAVGPASDDADNVVISDFAMTGKLAGVGQSTRFTATLRNYGKRPAGGQVSFHIDGAETRVDQQSVELIPPGGTQAVDFRYVFASAGAHQIEARFAADALETDNRRMLSVRVTDRVRTLVVDDSAPAPSPEEEDSFFVRTALEIGSGPGRPPLYAIKTATEVAFDREALDDYDLIVLANVKLVSERRAKDLEAFVESGGGLMMFTGDRVSADRFNAAFWKDGKGLSPAKLGQPIGEVRDRETGFDLVPADVERPPYDYFKDRRVRAMLLGAPIYRFHDASVDPEDPTVRVLARVQSRAAALDGPKPAIVERAFGAGRALLFLTSADRDWNDLPVFPVFVPLVKEPAYHAVRRAAERENLLVGDGWRRELDRPIREALVSRGAKQVQALRPVPTAGKETFEIRLDALDKAGFYRLDYAEAGDSGRAPEPPTILAVNVDPGESDLRRVSAAALASAFPEGSLSVVESIEDGGAAADSGSNEDLWRLLLWVVGGLMLAETFLSQWFGRARKGGVA